jgi:hypothetical protein
VLLGACAPGQHPVGPVPASPSPTTSGTYHTPEHEAPERPARATIALSPRERTRLGLPEVSGTAIDPTALPPLDEVQWADPEVVAVRFVLLRTNYRADEEPAALRARLRPYVVPRLDAELAWSFGGQAGLAELRAQEAVFAGDVVGVATTDRSHDRSVVDLTVQRSTTVGGKPDGARVSLWRLTLVRDAASGHWQVADLQLS